MPQADQENEQELLLPDNLEDCHVSLEETRQEVADLKDKYLRAAAQADNARKWTERDVMAREKEKQRKLLRELLEVVDSLDMALSHGQAENPASLYQGVQLTRSMLEKVLAHAGAERLTVEPGEPFDPAYHEAVEVREENSEQPAVAAVVKPGYLFEGKLLRPASVVVAR